MKYTDGHLNEEQLLDYRYGDLAGASAAVEQHLHECAECRTSYESLQSVLAMVEALPVAEPGPHFEARMWREISPKLARPGFDWSALAAWMSPKRLIPVGAVAAFVGGCVYGRAELRGRRLFLLPRATGLRKLLRRKCAKEFCWWPSEIIWTARNPC